MGEFRRLFERLKGAHLTVKPSKCQVGFNDLTFIGNHISELGIKPEESKNLDILMVPVPTTKKQVSWDLSAIAGPLSDLIKKGKPNRVKWENSEEKVFTALKGHLAKRPILEFARL